MMDLAPNEVTVEASTLFVSLPDHLWYFGFDNEVLSVEFETPDGHLFSSEPIVYRRIQFLQPDKVYGEQQNVGPTVGATQSGQRWRSTASHVLSLLPFALVIWSLWPDAQDEPPTLAKLPRLEAADDRGLVTTADQPLEISKADLRTNDLIQGVADPGIEIDTKGLEGKLSPSANGWTYLPPRNLIRTDVFRYRLSHGSHRSNEAVVKIYIEAPSPSVAASSSSTPIQPKHGNSSVVKQLPPNPKSKFSLASCVPLPGETISFVRIEAGVYEAGDIDDPVLRDKVTRLLNAHHGNPSLKIEIDRAFCISDGKVSVGMVLAAVKEGAVSKLNRGIWSDIRVPLLGPIRQTPEHQQPAQDIAYNQIVRPYVDWATSMSRIPYRVPDFDSWVATLIAASNASNRVLLDDLQSRYWEFLSDLSWSNEIWTIDSSELQMRRRPVEENLSGVGFRLVRPGR